MFDDTDTHLAVVLYAGSPRHLHLNAFRGELELASAGQTAGHAAAAGALGVAAVDVRLAAGPDGSFAGSWSIDLMPNGCAIFRTQTDLVGDALKHREAVATHVGNLIWDSMTENQPTDPAAWKAHTLAAIEARTFAIGYTKALLEHEDTTDHTYDQLRDRAVAAHRATRVSELMLTTP